MTAEADAFDSLWAYCTAENRLVPMPQHWNELYSRLKNTRQKPSGGWEPPLPLILAAWHDTTPIEKQLRFREHIKWARDQGQLAKIARYIRALHEADWYHLGEL